MRGPLVVVRREFSRAAFALNLPGPSDHYCEDPWFTGRTRSAATNVDREAETGRALSITSPPLPRSDGTSATSRRREDGRRLARRFNPPCASPFPPIFC